MNEAEPEANVVRPDAPWLGVHPDVLKLGLVSFLTDVSSEMIFSVFAVFFTTVAGASSALLGLVEGFADFSAEPLEGNGAAESPAEPTAEGEAEAQEGVVKIAGLTIQRYKGLGEMNPEQLWETTMNPANRVLLQVTIEDAQEADRVFDVLMGSEVAPRKKFIQTHARSVENLDI